MTGTETEFPMRQPAECETMAHVPNSGRLRELLVPGAGLYLRPALHAGRVTPYDVTLVRFGGTMEFAGLNESIDPRRVEAMVASIPAYLPQFAPRHFAGIAPWRGLRPITPDGLPYIGRTQRWRNLVVASGHAMMGVSLAPATGQLVSEILDGRAPSLPLAPFAPERFG